MRDRTEAKTDRTKAKTDRAKVKTGPKHTGCTLIVETATSTLNV
jgi:hypothetical protein